MSSCLMAMLAAIALSSFLFTADPKGQLVISNFKVADAKVNSRSQEVGLARFNLTADLTSLFHWNTKQLFIYVTAEYNNSDGTHNEVVIWDRIVLRKEDALVDVVVPPKYPLRDMRYSFKKSSPVRFALKYNLMPYVGALTYGEAARTEPEPFPPKVGKL
ncbi:signal peptidase 22 kDa subunit [Thelephora ganbajun]|uniref:Signal peptidase 22 kDa subunit n=1 Tax=Thelephora ganbajun TaxID=370292 RepID=A0ACB6ZM26_THEGA|nr:signal peptidase 22 kDa subunit [Thelephora ganbajun]